MSPVLQTLVAFAICVLFGRTLLGEVSFAICDDAPHMLDVFAVVPVGIFIRILLEDRYYFAAT
jgi:hypothetical protein